MSIKRQDNGERPLLIVQSVPLGRGWTEAGPFEVAAGTRLDLYVTTVPDNDLLGLWDFLFSIAVDTNATTHFYPNGSSLSAGQKSLRVTRYEDFVQSSDTDNERVNIIQIENPDSVDHDIWLYFKAYTFASVGGT